MELTLTTAPPTDRRLHERWLLPTGCASLGVRRKGRRDFNLRGPVRDISWSGVRFELDQTLEAGEEVEVKVKLSAEQAELLCATGRVVRFLSPQGPPQIAVAFTNIRNPADADQFTRSIHDALTPPGPRAA